MVDSQHDRSVGRNRRLSVQINFPEIQAETQAGERSENKIQHNPALNGLTKVYIPHHLECLLSGFCTFAAVKHRYLIVIAGCTGVGKTRLALQVAKHFRTAIVSADSRQIYREMSIGVARPSSAELELVPHYMIGSHSILQPFDVVQYELEVLKILEQLYRDHDVVVMAGGTGLYLKAVLDGMDPLPPNDPATLETLQALFNLQGIEPLQEELMRRDPSAAKAMDVKNPRRLLRALCVMRQTGKPISEFWQGAPVKRTFIPVPVWLRLDRQALHQRINQRVGQMMEAGLLGEVSGLMPFRGSQALETVGYQELFEYLEGNSTLEEAVDWIKVHTRQYAKRQETWFRKYFKGPDFSPDATAEIMAYLTQTIQNHEKIHLEP